MRLPTRTYLHLLVGHILAAVCALLRAHGTLLVLVTCQSQVLHVLAALLALRLTMLTRLVVVLTERNRI